eukprot:scaffold23084_cov153-Skeletonema_dohrnii-CCMP3373.AAC.4
MQMQEGPITDADGLVDITAADEDAFNNFHIVAIHAAIWTEGEKRVLGGKECCWLAAVSPVLNVSLLLV